jgi:hypothetical protein
MQAVHERASRVEDSGQNRFVVHSFRERPMLIMGGSFRQIFEPLIVV